MESEREKKQPDAVIETKDLDKVTIEQLISNRAVLQNDTVKKLHRKISLMVRDDLL
jgi:hypothetical protein